MSDILHVGDTVLWRGTFGEDSEKEAIVIGIAKGKNGYTIPEIEWDKFKNRDYIVDLDNGHWAYADQIRKVG